MFKDLIIKLLSLASYNQTTAAAALGYKTQSALQSVIIKKDIRLTVLLSVCNLCNFQIIITDNKGININLNDYYQQRQDQHASNDDSGSK